ncbi:MAG: methyltransferase [Alphaproteobacteria bacterium]
MICDYKDCGGCKYKELSFDDYQKKISQNREQVFFAPFCSRRRVNFSFVGKKFGFYQAKSHNIIDVEKCNAVCFDIKKIKEFVLMLGYKEGEAFITKAANGLALKVVAKAEITLDNKLDLADFLNANDDIISIAINDYEVKKAEPYINICGVKVFINPDSFLQATQESEAKMVELCSQYLKDTNGKILDLFCGLGTFSYSLCGNIKNKITSIDSNDIALDLFKKTVNANQIANIDIKTQNLIKYPLTAEELETFDAIVFDPPYKGALNQVKEICKCNKMFKKIVAISCNEESFNVDKKELENKGYKLTELTYVDQFLYSDHIELVALFEG